MGDGGFWHNGLITGVASNLFNKNDGVLIVMQNGYTSATGLQYMPSSANSRQGTAPGMDVESTLRSFGVKWMRKVRTYSVATMVKTLKEAMRTAETGLKVIIADGECQLARQRRVRAEDAVKLKAGERVVRTKFGVDDEICTGDHSCIRLSGCPSLTVKPSPDPLRTDPVASVIESCVGCGLCGEVAHAAVLCPSFYRAELIQNASALGSLHASRAPHGHRVARAARGGGVSERPITLLIAALGGEGGGVLTDWIVSAAEACDLPVQSTSIPGVAQRTGATTYYIEIFPVPHAQARRQASGARARARRRRRRHGGGERAARSRPRDLVRLRHRRPHAARSSSTSRVYLTIEKMQMADGRYDCERLVKAVEQNAKEHLLFDMEAAAKQAGAIVNSVMLGAIAGSGRLPIPVEAFEAAIKADGKAVESNLRGFRAGLAASRATSCRCRWRAPASARRNRRLQASKPKPRALPEAARAFATEGVRRLVAYQNLDYARLYLDRLKPVAEADARAHANGKLLAETARHLAVRMSFEDVIRVAEAKIAPERFRRIEGEIGAKDQPYVITEFLKPGIEELCQVLPPRLARAIVGYSEKRGWLGTVYFGMELKTTTVWGYLRFWGLAKLKRFRPKSWRFAEEQIAIEAWLARVVAAAKLSPDLALEVAECARLIKGYGDTWKRGCVELRDDRGARDRAGARRPHPGARRHRRGRLGPHRRAARSGRRGSGQGTRGDRRAGRDAAGGGVARAPRLRRAHQAS